MRHGVIPRRLKWFDCHRDDVVKVKLLWINRSIAEVAHVIEP